MGTKLKRTCVAGECEDGLAETGQRALDQVQSLRIEHRDSMPYLGTQSSCQGSIQLPQSRKLSFLFPLASASLAVHLLLAATSGVSVSYRPLSLLSWSKYNLCTEAWILGVGITRNYVN